MIAHLSRRVGRAAAFAATFTLLVLGVASPANAEGEQEHCVILLDDDTVQTFCADTVEAADAAFSQSTGLTRVESADVVGERLAFSLATLYVNAGYGGSSYTFTRSTACNGVTLSSIPDLAAVGIGDAVSSFLTYSSCTVRLYADASYGGSTYGYTTSQSSLPTFNDVASAARAR